MACDVTVHLYATLGVFIELVKLENSWKFAQSGNNDNKWGEGFELNSEHLFMLVISFVI